MSNDLIPLHFDQADVRMVMRDGEPWWVLNDVAAVLGIANPRNIAARLEDYQKGVHSMDTLGGRQDIVIVNEPGVYALTLASRRPEAKRFARWLFIDVLTSIRKHGFYDPVRLAAQQAATVQAALIPSDRNERLQQEIAAFTARSGLSIFDIPGMSKQKLFQLQVGADMEKALSKKGLWFHLMAYGFDIPYIIWGKNRHPREWERPVASLIAKSEHKRIEQ